ncbi:MAG: LLM class flavin-dependent oxidoreductase [Alphaproteobacteria bacterium]|nr:LLM class flavin-dependent oxidoreductase [Alphaproteobacteria bacterium]
MKFGYLCNPATLRQHETYGEIVDHIRDIAVHCDRSGFDSIWFSEHHFGFWQRKVLPNPIMMGADIAARTKRLRIGFAAATITFWHPLRLAEDVALLDQFSGGRVELGVGRGNYGVEGMNLNPMADPRKQADNYKVFAETLAILKLAFSQKNFSFKGEKYTFPDPGFTWERAVPEDAPEFLNMETKELLQMQLMPRPVQQPHPPLWQMVDEPKSVEFAAKNALNIMMWRPTPRKLAHHFKHYQEAAASVGRKVPLGAGTAILRDTFVAETRDEARDMAAAHVMKPLNFSNWRGPGIYLDPDEKLPEEQDQALRKNLPYEFVEPRSLLFGSPEYVVDKIHELREIAQVERIVITGAWGSIDPELTMRSLRLFSEKVLPKFA